MTAHIVLHAIVVGLAGVAAFDAWNLMLQRLRGVRAPNWAILGRWMLAPLRLGSAGPFSPLEKGLGTAAHYLSGTAFALALALAAGPAWVEAPTPGPAVAAGLATVLLAWFVIMPALGHGPAASKAPSPWKARAATAAAHTVMGAGFYLGALAAAAVL
jgi:hypothetical protein